MRQESARFHSLMPFVIGGNIRQAQELITRKQLADCIAIDDPEALRDLENPDVILTGTFIARHDVQSFYDMFKQTGATSRFVA
jgi:hypothetical protein